MDETFHQKYAARIDFKEMDPSLALVRIYCDLFSSYFMLRLSKFEFLMSKKDIYVIRPLYSKLIKIFISSFLIILSV